MRKLICLIAILCLAVPVFSFAAFAAESYEFLPVDVSQTPDRSEIRKVYEMATSVDPSMIPRSNFERDNFYYTCRDILREVVIGDEVKTLTEMETIDSPKNDIESVMNLLPPVKEVTTEDGFFGTLYLNTSSIKSEVSGYGSKTSPVNITRNYPNLSDADTQYIPKTVTENGKTFTLSDIQWNTDNTYNVDDYEIGNRYTATATYSGSKTTSYVKGYTVTADYTGEVCRTGVSIIRYTVIFSGVEITVPEPEPDPTPVPDPTLEPPLDPVPGKASSFNWGYIIIPLALLTLASTGGVTYLILNKRKENRNYAETTGYDYADTYPSGGGDVPRDGGGV